MTTIIEQWQEHIEHAIASGGQLNIRGGGSKAFYGQAPVGEPLDTNAHRGVVNYEPSELVITARAGTPLTELEDVLAEKGQMLAFEPPHFGQATVGGCIAAGLAGPRRTRAGGVRDYVLGTQLLDGRGKILNFGGQVMKNVAGYDISRFLAGSLGILGVITEASLKVLPLPEYEQTLQLPMRLDAALTAMRSWAGKPMPISATLWQQDKLSLRLSGASSAVEATAKALGGERLAEDAAILLWRQLKEQQTAFFVAGSRPLWRLALPARAKVPFSELCEEQDILLEWNGGQCWLLSESPAAEIREFMSRVGGHATLFRGGDKSQGVFTPLAAPIHKLHTQLKLEFDPAGIFNPGRMYPSL